ncbi:Creatine kinase B-type-like isoform X1 [Oopsacas minuta]|uniref:Creatine kinase B-type-like isoform X1 n=1 Tax=Oopsacas minuta TaxID=111878 RepID=A0AAV7JSV7_9METZ|nr:Creatine kinase B-type-like isoform X1 [Oopsacas minuta]
MITSNNTLLLTRLEKVPTNDKLNKRPARLSSKKFTSTSKTNVKSDNLLLSREKTGSSLLYYKRLETNPGLSKPIYSPELNKVVYRGIHDNINHEFISHFSTPLEFKKRDSNLPNLNISQRLKPKITPLTCTSGNNHFGVSTSSILSKHCRQTNTFNWVKHKIPLPPPNLEQVERKLYPHRFKIVLKDITTFFYIPSPPPPMREVIILLELIPPPPPDIPRYLMSGIHSKTIKVRTDRVPNPILSIIPDPPPNLPNESQPILDRIDPTGSDFRAAHLLEIVKAANLREKERISKSQKAVIRDNRNTNPVDFHAIHLQEIINVANLREKERISKSQKVNMLLELIPSPPPDIPSYLLSEIIPQTIKIRTDCIPNPILSIIPDPPPNLPNESQPIRDRSDSNGSWDSIISPTDASDFRAAHLQEIVKVANLREKERISKSQKVIMLLELIPSPPPDIPSYLLSKIIPQTIKIRTDCIPNPILSIIPDPPPNLPNESQPIRDRTDSNGSWDSILSPTDASDFRAAHLQEIVKVANLREKERISKSQKVIMFLESDSTDSWDSIISPTDASDFRAAHLQEIVKVANLREKERISKSQKVIMLLELIPSPPPDIPSYLLSKIIPQTIKIRTDCIPNPILSIIPDPPPNLPNESRITTPPFLKRSADSAGSWDSTIPPDSTNFHAIHLQEIVYVANLREKDRIYKSQKVIMLFQSIPSPPPDIPYYKSTGNLPQVIKGNRVSNPVLLRIPNPPPNLPNESEVPSPPFLDRSDSTISPTDSNFRAVHLKEIVKVANHREKERISKSQKAVIRDYRNTNPVDFHAKHLQEIVNVANLREKERISKSQKVIMLPELIPSPPPDIPSYLLSKIIPQTIKIRTDRIPNPILSIIPDPPPNLPNESQPIRDRSDSSGSWDSILSPDSTDFHAIHLQEIVNVANFREKDRISKSQNVIRGDNRNTNPVDFRAIHLQEIVTAANLRDKSTKKFKNILQVSDRNFPQLHLEEIQRTSLDRQQERYDTKNLPTIQSTRLSICLPCLKKKSYFLKLISALGLTPVNNDIFIHKHTQSSIKFPIEEILNLLTEVENNLLMDKPIREILPQCIWNICASSYPDLTRSYNHMSRHLTAEMYNRLSKLKTASGFTIDQAIQTGVDNPGDPFSLSVGCVAGDEDSYSKFSELFDPVIYSANNGYTLDRVHCSDFDPYSIKDGYFDPNYVLSCQVLAARSIKGFPLLPHCTRGERRGVENVVKECITNMPHPFKGSYYPLSSIKQDVHGYLTARNFLFTKPTSPLIISARMNRGWPDARAMWLNRDENFMAWVNTEDHIRLISMEEGGDFKSVFERFCLGVQLFEMTVSLRGHAVMKSDHLGYLLTCPSNLGTGMIITITMTSPKLLSYPGFEIILEFLRLEKKGKIDSKTGEFQVCNKDRLGFTEVELAQSLIHSVQLLIRIEKTLWSGLDLIKFLQEVKPELANLLLVGVYPKDNYNRIMIPKFIPSYPADILA